MDDVSCRWTTASTKDRPIQHIYTSPSTPPTSASQAALSTPSFAIDSHAPSCRLDGMRSLHFASGRLGRVRQLSLAPPIARTRQLVPWAGRRAVGGGCTFGLGHPSLHPFRHHPPTCPARHAQSGIGVTHSRSVSRIVGGLALKGFCARDHAFTVWEEWSGYKEFLWVPAHPHFGLISRSGLKQSPSDFSHRCLLTVARKDVAEMRKCVIWLYPQSDSELQLKALKFVAKRAYVHNVKHPQIYT